MDRCLNGSFTKPATYNLSISVGDGYFQELIIYPSDKSSDRASMYSNLDNYYN